jgi:hypothetical protein
VGINIEISIDKLLAMIGDKTKIELNQLHKQLGHPNQIYTLAMAKIYDWETHGDWKICEDCALCKIQQKNVAKITKSRSQVPSENLLLDISSVQ